MSRQENMWRLPIPPVIHVVVCCMRCCAACSLQSESSLHKLQDVEQLGGRFDQMRNENELLRFVKTQCLHHKRTCCAFPFDKWLVCLLCCLVDSKLLRLVSYVFVPLPHKYTQAQTPLPSPQEVGQWCFCSPSSHLHTGMDPTSSPTGGWSVTFLLVSDVFVGQWCFWSPSSELYTGTDPTSSPAGGWSVMFLLVSDVFVGQWCFDGWSIMLVC